MIEELADNRKRTNTHSKTVTSYPSAEGYIKKRGAVYFGHAVETDKILSLQGIRKLAYKICGMPGK